jgi:hypothetical protein
LDLDKYYEDGRPRRPANGFSFFCGDMCAKVRNEKLPISGTIAYAAEIWKKMSNEEKRVSYCKIYCFFKTIVMHDIIPFVMYSLG